MILRPTWTAAAGVITAMLLLMSFYIVVTDAARTAHALRQKSLATHAKLAVCGMRSASAQELCMLTVASRAPTDSTALPWTAQTPSNSTSNIKVAFGGMAPPAPRVP